MVTFVSKFYQYYIQSYMHYIPTDGWFAEMNSVRIIKGVFNIRHVTLF